MNDLRVPQKQTSKGFSVIELIVAIGIILVVLVAGIDIMLHIVRAQQKAVAVKDVLDNARFPLELMTREMYTATNIKYMDPPPIGCGRPGIQYTSHNQASPQNRYYFLEDTDGDFAPDALMRVAMSNEDPIDCTKAEQLTSQEVRVITWGLSYDGDALGPTDGQPRWTITMVLDSRNPRFGQETRVSIETTIVPIAPDL